MRKACPGLRLGLALLHLRACSGEEEGRHREDSGKHCSHSTEWHHMRGQGPSIHLEGQSRVLAMYTVTCAPHAMHSLHRDELQLPGFRGSFVRQCLLRTAKLVFL